MLIKMNKKQVKSLFLFLTLLMLTLAITAVSAADTNDTTSVSDNSNTQSVALDEKTGYDYSLEKNNEQMYKQDDSSDTKTKVNEDTTSVRMKSLEKKNETTSKEATYKRYSTLTIGSTKSAYVGDNVSVYGKLSSNSINIANAKITVTVDNKNYYVTTSKYGNYNLKVSTSTSGTKTITAKYAGSTDYYSSQASTTYQSNKKTTIITVGSTKSAYVGDSVSVYGKLTARGIALAYAKITVTVDGKKYDATTSKYGNYNLKVSSQTDGTKTVTVNYMGTNIYAKSTNQTTYQSNKKITEITVGSTKSVYVGDKVSVYGKLSARGIALAYKNVTIDVKGVKYYTTTSKYGNYNLKVVANNQGYNTITATYAGTNIYASDSTTTYFQANKKVTTITVGSTSSVNLGDSISIYGKLSARGIGLAYKTVTIDVEGDTYTATTSKYGNYKITVPTYYEGYNTIMASYAGTNIYTSDSASTSFNAMNKKTVITLYDIPTVKYSSYSTISGILKDNNGKALQYYTINLNINGNSYSTSTDYYGKFTYYYKSTKVGTNNVKATFNGNSYYDSSSATKTFQVKGVTTYITINDVGNPICGDEWHIDGYLYDEYGNALKYKTVKLTINDKVYYPTTSKDGFYYIWYEFNKVGTNKITAYYGGDSIYSSVSKTSTFSVQQANLVYGEVVHEGSKYFTHLNCGGHIIYMGDEGFCNKCGAEFYQDTRIK